MRTIYVHRADHENPGDLYSCPKHYIHKQFTPVQIIDVSSPEEPVDADVVIVGGGDIISKRNWIVAIDKILEKRKKAKKVLWGAGCYMGSDLIGLDLMKKFDHIGIRNTNQLYDWVPCASTFNKAFQDSPKAPKNEILIIDHFKRNLYCDLPVTRVVNKPQTFEKMVGKIKEHDLIITNSYHAAFWSTILSKRVIVVGLHLPAKLTSMKHPPLIIPSWDDRAIDIAWRYPNAYNECIEATKDFYKKIQ